MPIAEYFPYMGPNRRSDLPVVEVTLNFAGEAYSRFPENVSVIQDLLVAGGILAPGESFPEEPLPDDLRTENFPLWYTTLLLQTALTFQRKAGHRVSHFSVDFDHRRKRCVGFMEHEHCDVGMTAMKLALELLRGQRKLLADPFKAFKLFARDRLLPVETEAIIQAAKKRNIPCVQLDRNRFRRTDFDEITGGRVVLPNGLLMLGHGANRQILDGTYCLGKAEDFADLPRVGDKPIEALQLADPDTGRREIAANQVLDWLFPEASKVRMPIIAVTGTNGKTTTCRMINHILSGSGRNPGMVCTDGIYLNNELLIEGDKSARSGHFKVLANDTVDTAVLETHHRGILEDGFLFLACDIAACLNVSDDHLGSGGIESVEQMANVKRALIERASEAAILNADDSHCMLMINAVSAKTLCLVSMNGATDLLKKKFEHPAVCFSVLESVEGVEWLVIYQDGLRLPVVAVNQVPATFSGTARFNISNALHAMAACHLAGIDVLAISSALQTFKTSYKTTPGRLNIYDDLPFRIIVDFAHNPDGMRRLAEFIDRQDVAGRKVLAFAGSGDRLDESIKNMGRSMAGHFDFYFCKEHVFSKEGEPRLVAHILQQGLIEEGVSIDQTLVTTNGRDVMFDIFDACKKGDLLVMLLGHVEKHQIAGYIEEYRDISAGQNRL